MNARPFATKGDASGHDARIDAALQVYAHAEPEPGLESRIAARLSANRPGPRFRFSLAEFTRLLVLRRLSVGALAGATAAVIVVGTVQHSHRTMPPQVVRAPQTGGVGVANRVHVPTHPMPQGATIDPAAPRVPPHGRANVSRNPAHRASGAAVPRSPYPPGQQSSNSTEPQQ